MRVNVRVHVCVSFALLQTLTHVLCCLSLSHPRSADAHTRDEVHPHTKLLPNCSHLSCAHSLSNELSLSLWVRRLFEITAAAQQLRIRSVGSEASERVRRMRARPQHKKQQRANYNNKNFRYSRKLTITTTIALQFVFAWVACVVLRESYRSCSFCILCVVVASLCMLRRAWNIATKVTTTTATKGTTKRKII